MKTALVVCAVVALLALVESAPQQDAQRSETTEPQNPEPNPQTNSRGCFYVMGHCVSRCEEGTHAYSTGCGYLMPERTCDNPHPTLDTRGYLCDYSRCECDEPKVRDVSTDKCVLLEDCPKKTEDGGNSMVAADRTSTIV